MDRELAELIERLETELLQPEVRRSPDRISELLADDFIEFGISGKSTKQDMLRFCLRARDQTIRLLISRRGRWHLMSSSSHTGPLSEPTTLAR